MRLPFISHDPLEAKVAIADLGGYSNEFLHHLLADAILNMVATFVLGQAFSVKHGTKRGWEELTCPSTFDTHGRGNTPQAGRGREDRGP